MVIIYILLIAIQAGVIVYFWLLRRKNKPEEPAVVEQDRYTSLRQQSVGVTPAQLGIAVQDSYMLVYGVVMDWNMGDAIVTLAAYLTGAANMYFSTGEAITGGGRSPRVGEVAVELAVAAKDFLDRSVLVEEALLPANGCVRFLLLTNHGMYGAQEHVRFLQDGTSNWLLLFEMANRVLTEIQGGNNGEAMEEIVLS